jgi:serine/threonine protein phosphatase PrpC
MQLEEVVALTHTGRVLETNEDALLRLEEIPLLCIADGLGGPGVGDVAAQLALEVIAGQAPQLAEQVRKTGLDHSSRNRLALGKSLAATLEKASIEVQKEAERAGAPRMGASVLLATLSGSDLHLAHVGNCRGWLYRQGEMLALTDDHSVAMFQYRRGKLRADELAKSPLRSRLTQLVGGVAPPEPDLAEVSLASGDLLVLCTDGLHHALTEDQIAEILGSAPLPEAGEQLLKAALAASGDDNVSLLLARFSAGGDQASLQRRAEILQKVYLFQDLAEPERRAIAPYLERHTLLEGQELFREGDPGDSFYMVLSGSVRLSRNNVAILEVESGSHFGELSLVTEGPRTVTATALETTTVYRLDRAAFLELVRGMPELGTRLCLALLGSLGERVKVLTNRISDLERP